MISIKDALSILNNIKISDVNARIEPSYVRPNESQLVFYYGTRVRSTLGTSFPTGKESERELLKFEVDFTIDHIKEQIRNRLVGLTENEIEAIQSELYSLFE